MKSPECNTASARARDKLIRWVDRGTTPASAERVAPPRADRLSTNAPGGPILNDEHGVAIGGVRTTYVDVPISRFELCNVGVSPATPVGFSLGGYEVPFPPEKLAELYRSPREYVRRVNRRLNELIREGWYLREDADEIRARAEETAADWERNGVF
jgi:hypothetical protein